ncbi:hypothetical protein C8R41DRAFT_923018 [Lentinula lateritia]|uniref:Small EDRK-rich factor-like N-terminal domain-containing protein n=1 Tax=Lentinula lateritia TaxID=40482 RepID=A0ABQ8V6U3_9AGAR|nr:hypothetical protein C8R41DRAFT_923018 [Lentinula lateritia]
MRLHGNNGISSEQEHTSSFYLHCASSNASKSFLAFLPAPSLAAMAGWQATRDVDAQYAAQKQAEDHRKAKEKAKVEKRSATLTPRSEKPRQAKKDREAEFKSERNMITSICHSITNKVPQ